MPIENAGWLDDDEYRVGSTTAANGCAMHRYAVREFHEVSRGLMNADLMVGTPLA